MTSVDSILEESITDFFSKAGTCTTRSQCDAFAGKTFGGLVKPVSHQGVYSYTVVAANDTIIVQFREPDSPLDAEMLAIVRNTHPDFVAACSFHGTIGSSPALLIYSMDKLPGDNYLNVSLSLSDDELDHRLATVRSLARFFAQSWKNSSQPGRDTISSISENCYSNLDYLSNNLPSRFQKAITRVRESFPALFSGEYPLVVTHGDLSEMNILADPATGDVTGIIDWAEAGILPFGFALYALDHILGYLTPTGWVFNTTAVPLQDEFWRVFNELVGGLSKSNMELIQLARLAGLFLRYGIPYRPGHKGAIGLGGSHTSIQILDALTQG